MHHDELKNEYNRNKCIILLFMRSIFYTRATCFGPNTLPSSGNWHQIFFKISIPFLKLQPYLRFGLLHQIISGVSTFDVLAQVSQFELL